MLLGKSIQKQLGIDTANQFMADPLQFLLEQAAEQGGVATFKIGPAANMVLVTQPDYIRDLLVKHWRKTIKWHRMANSMRATAKYNIAILEGDVWQQHRKLLTPAFHTQRIKAYLGLMQKHTLAAIQTWQDGDIRDMTEAMTNITLSIISEILFDLPNVQDDAAELTHAFDVLLTQVVIDSSALFKLPRWIPTERHQREREAKNTVESYLDDLIQKRCAEGNDHGDVLSALIDARDADTGEALSNGEIRDELYALFVAGHETTAVLMMWALHLLATHPHIQEKLYQEVTQIVQNTAPSLDDLAALTYTDQVIKETLRRYPPAWSLFLRDVVEDIVLDDVTIPKGSVLYISPYVQHHLPQYWDNPQQFDPSRFAGDWKDRLPNYVFMPFGGGARVCIGAHMAEMEAKIMLATIIKHFAIEPATDDEHIYMNTGFTLRPWQPIRLSIHKRNAKQA